MAEEKRKALDGYEIAKRDADLARERRRLLALRGGPQNDVEQSQDDEDADIEQGASPHQINRPYFINISDKNKPCTADPPYFASEEALGILKYNQANREVSTYWAPGLADPNCTGQALSLPYWENVVEQKEGLFLGRNAKRSTFTHV